ncbi:MAG: type I polyketide synthase [Chitinophagales bacterium]
MNDEQLKQMQQLLQKSLIKIKTLEAELENTKPAAAHLKEPVAIVGCGVRLPENINTTGKLWQLIQEKKSAVKEIPKDRFDINGIYDADGNKAGKTNARFGTFLENDVRAFDAPFFSISPREAKCIDPLQRMVLEVVYEAFENAGIPSSQLKGSRTGVYIALGNSDYISARFRSGNLETVDLYDTTGILFGTAGGRVSFLYDFCGPSYNVDAACASTLLAMHLAKEDLQKNTIDVAVVASANLLLTPEMFVGLSKLGSLSSTNQCKAFADDCDGYVRGEGCGVVLLKRLSDAEKNNDTIDLIIKGSSVKHNGNTNGFTAPNPEVISSNIKEALSESGVDVNDVAFVESHGIGNRFTDAVEVQSINEGYIGRTRPIYIGSVKANIGHLEAGTGMPMLFKVIEAVRHQTIPAQINISALNQDVDWNAIQSRIPLDNEPWQTDNGKPLYAAINLSGYSGTNAHMIFEAPKPQQRSDEMKGPFHFILSAKDAVALKNTARKYLDDPGYFDKHTLTEICYTLQEGRNHFDYSVSILADDKQAVLDGLNDFVSDNKSEKYVASHPESERNKEPAFLFTGQGAQYFGMCKGYYDSFDLFRKVMDDCDELLRPHLEHSLKDILWGDAIDKNLLHQTRYTQPALFVVEYALARLWMSVGVQPSVLIGHSIGEIVALAVANVFSLQDALKLVVARAALMNALPADTGGMASVFCNEATLRPLLQHAEVDLAAVNSVKNCTVSGKKEDIQSFIEKLKEHNIKAVPLNVSHAFHSRLMEPILERFTAFVQQIPMKTPDIPVISNLTGREISRQDLSAEYFSNHIRQAVQFSAGVQFLQQQNIDIYLEVGPTPVLISLAKQSNTSENAVWLSSAKKDEDNARHFHQTLQQLYSAGIQIKWNGFYTGKRINRVILPTYGWNWKVYWENPVFGQKPTVHSPQSKVTDKKGGPMTVDRRTETPKATRETLLAYMQIEAAKVLGLEAGQKVDINKTYREQGFDSMMSGEFLMLMEKHIGAELRMETLHQYNMPRELHRYLIDTYFGGGEIDTTQAITLADIMFSQEMESLHQENWHEIKPEDGALLRWFKKIDKLVPSVRE